MTRVACLGECMVELVEQPDGTLRRGFGGDTLNTAVYLARLGVAVDYVTALGDDPFSDEMLAAWQAEGVGVGQVARAPGRAPGLYLIRTAPSGERSFFYWRDSAPVRGLFARPDAERIADALAAHGLVYVSGITLSLFDAASLERLFAALAQTRAQGGRVAFDTNFRPRAWPDRAHAQAVFARALALADIAFASVEDHGLMTGARDPAAATAWLAGSGAREWVLKHDAPACDVQAGGVIARVVAPPVAEVVDTTAAGDSFAAAYLAARLAGAEPSAAAAAGHRLAGRVVRHRGAIIPRAAMADLPG